jgi:hypothetical protein
MGKKTSSGLGLPGVLFIVFLTLKLTGNIDWPWLWVTAPLWVPLALGAVLAIAIVLMATILLAIGYSPEKIKERFNIK